MQSTTWGWQHMARKQAKRRKPKKARQIRLPSIRRGRILAPLAAIAVVLATYQISLLALDRQISSIEISAPFQRVTALQIEEAISDEIDLGFIGADLDRIRARIVAMPWIDQARVARELGQRVRRLRQRREPVVAHRVPRRVEPREHRRVRRQRHAVDVLRDRVGQGRHKIGGLEIVDLTHSLSPGYEDDVVHAGCDCLESRLDRRSSRRGTVFDGGGTGRGQGKGRGTGQGRGGQS